MIGALSGCGQKESATDNRYYDQASPIGYYTSEHNPYVNNDQNRGAGEQRRGNARLFEDNDGPINEILDRSVVYNENRIRKNNEGIRNIRNRGGHGGYLGIGYNTPHFSRTDRNYHGHLNNLENVGNPSYYNRYEGRLSEQLSNRAEQVDGVKNAGVLISKGEVLVAVVPERGANDREVSRAVERALEPLVKNKELRVGVNESAFNAIRNVDNDLRNSEWRLNDLESNMRGIYRTMTQ